MLAEDEKNRDQDDNQFGECDAERQASKRGSWSVWRPLICPTTEAENRFLAQGFFAVLILGLMASASHADDRYQ